MCPAGSELCGFVVVALRDFVYHGRSAATATQPPAANSANIYGCEKSSINYKECITKINATDKNIKPGGAS